MHNRAKFHSARNRRPLTRAEAARVIAAPFPKRASGPRWPIAGRSTVGRGGVAQALAIAAGTWLVIIALCYGCWVINFGW